MRRVHFVLFLLGPVSLLACGDDGSSNGEDIAMTDPLLAAACDAIELEPPAAGKGFQTVTAFALEPGQERETCKLVKPGKVNLNWAEGLYTRGAHHGVVMRTSYRDDVPAAGANTVDCAAPGDLGAAGRLVAGRAVGTEPNRNTMPKGLLPSSTALKIDAGEVLLLNFHAVNSTEKTMRVCYKQNLNGIGDDDVKTEAGLIALYNSFITVPAGGTSKADMACPVTADVSLLSAVSHMHERGVGYTATLLDGDPIAGAKEKETLYQGAEWSEPEVRQFDPPIALQKGDWIRWACEYENPEARNVAQGRETTDEMCTFDGLYWPRNASLEACAPDGTGRNFGSGELSGRQLVACWNKSAQLLTGRGPTSSADCYDSQRCVTEACPEASALANDYIVRDKQDILSVTCNQPEQAP